MNQKLTLENTINLKNLKELLRKIVFRGLYDSKGINLMPYKKARFKMATIIPPNSIELPPEIKIGNRKEYLFTPQPTIYENQIEIMEIVDKFLRSEGRRINNLNEAIQYNWEGRGVFHILPPIIERHIYDLKDGYLDLKKLSRKFRNTYVKDARGNLHQLGNKNLENFYIDEVSKFDHIDVFNQNTPIINYGLKYNGKQIFNIICDGAHRIDYSIEKIRKPITAIVVESNSPTDSLIPYYAFPVSFKPTLRLSSKKSERMYYRLERDKIHLLNDFIKKALHYNWETANLSVSKLRSNVEIN